MKPNVELKMLANEIGDRKAIKFLWTLVMEDVQMRQPKLLMRVEINPVGNPPIYHYEIREKTRACIKGRTPNLDYLGSLVVYCIKDNLFKAQASYKPDAERKRE